MFYGQNCSGRFGENRSIISVAGSREDIGFIRLLDELKLRKIKRDLNQSHFSKAVELACKHSIKVSMAVTQNNKYFEWKRELQKYPNWFARLYGIICAKALEQIKDKKILLHMDREYDSRTLGMAADTICQLLGFQKENVYIRKEGEYPTNRIIAADLFARGYFKGYDCSQFSIIKNPDIKNEIKEVFEKHR
ncbi:MAG: hypothetical protein AABX32_02680 [Nanoarchaeota archaeon]